MAVNRKKKGENQENEADFFKVTAWRERAEVCAKYLAKGRKVAVVGSVSVSTYTGNDGQFRASLDVTADEVEFLSSRNDNPAQEQPKEEPKYDPQTNFQQVEMDELPF